MSLVVEKYYTVQQLAWLLEFDRKTILEWVKAGKFGPHCLNVGGTDIRVPASGVNAWRGNQLLAQDTEPIAARSAGELKRKAAAVS